VRVISRKTLSDFAKEHADVRDALFAWYHEAESATWKTPQDIKNKYASVSFPKNRKDTRVIFNIKGNKYRLEVSVAYNTGTVFIKNIETHAEYTKRHKKGGRKKKNESKNYKNRS
jgi:mRNA interferase HigB